MVAQKSEHDRMVALVLGGSHAEIPLINDLKRRGYWVVSTGNQPSGLGHCFSDEYLEGDFSDLSQMLSVANRCSASAIVSGCNDFAMITAAHVAHHLGFPGYDRLENVRAIHHKDRFRDLLRSLEIPIPQFVILRQTDKMIKVPSDLVFPVIVKPVDLTGGKGITVCSSKEELSKAVSYAFERTREERIVVESFIAGSRHGITTLIKDQKVVFTFTDDEQYSLNPFLVAGTTYPSSLTDQHIATAVSYLEQIASSLGLVDGLVHAQAILNGDDVYLVEVCRRCPGDLYPWFVERATQFPYTSAILDPLLGVDGVSPNHDVVQRYIARRCIMADSPGRVTHVEIQPKCSVDTIDLFTWFQPGDIIRNSLTEKLGVVFFEFKTRSDFSAYQKTHGEWFRVVR